MKIDRVELFIVELPLIRTFATSSSSKNFLRHILVKTYANGLIGWGECACPTNPYYCEETTETCWHLLNDFLVPSILKKDWESIMEVPSQYQNIKRNNFAKAGLEMACWNLLSQEKKLPLAKLLGGTRREIKSGVSLGIEQDRNKLFDLIHQYIDEGYHRIKLKISPGNDVEVIKAVRMEFPDLPLMVDANSAYSINDLPVLRELDAFDLMMIEQPLSHDDIVDHVKLQQELKTPICLDESIHSVDDARKALELGSCKIINIKISRVGGLLEAKKIHDFCLQRQIPVWCGGMHEYGIGRAANIAISSLPGYTIPGDVSGSDKYFKEDLVDPPIRAVNGTIQVPQISGLGYHPNEQRIQKHTIRKLILS